MINHPEDGLREDFAVQIIKDCRTTPAVDFKSRLGFNQHDTIMIQEQSILIKIMSVFSAESMIFQLSVLSYRIDAYFPKYKLATEVDEQEHKDRDIAEEIQKQKALKKSLIVNLLELIQLKKILIFLLRLVKYKIF